MTMQSSSNHANFSRPRLAAALAAAARGWPVFPLYPFSKYPAVADWENRATCDPDELAAWWSTAPYNTGIACGPADLVVLDLDAAHGHNPPEEWADLGVAHGRDVLRILADRAGQPDPIDTYTVLTPRGGEHRYFHAPPGQQLRPTVAKLGWRIDTRAAGGNIVAAGSIRRINRRPRLYRLVRDGRVAPLPDWLVLALTPPPAPEREPVHLATGRRIDAYVRAALDAEVDHVTHAVPGTRALVTFKAAAALGELVGAGVLEEAVAVEALVAAARRHEGIDSWTEREALHHIHNGIDRGRRNPREITGLTD